MSAWSRFWTTPLLLVPVWTRKPVAAAVVATWFAVNPVMTPEPAHERAFATRAMLGEEMWSADPARDRALTGLNLVGSLVLATGLIAAWQRRAVLAGAATTMTMAATMISWRRYAKVFDEEQNQSPGPRTRSS